MWYSYLPELDFCLSLVLVILYGLYSLVNQNISLYDIVLFCRFWPLLLCAGWLFDGISYTNYGSSQDSLSSIFGGSLFDWGAMSHTTLETTYATTSSFTNIFGFGGQMGIDFMLSVLMFAIMPAFKSFESLLFLMLAYVGQIFMLHSCDLLSFYVSLELQNFCFIILCGLLTSTYSTVLSQKSKKVHTNNTSVYGGLEDSVLRRLRPQNSVLAGSVNISSSILTSTNKQNSVSMVGSQSNDSTGLIRPIGFNVEASLKYLVLSAFSSGVILFWFSMLYLKTGTSVLFFKNITAEFNVQLESFIILLAIMFKLGAAPLHMWMVDIYSGVKRPLLLYVSTAPKLSLFGFWVSSWHSVWTDFSVVLFVAFSVLLGSFGAFAQPGLRSLFVYSTINEIGLLLMALEVAGFHTLFQHLSIYIVTQLMLWNLSDKRLFCFIAVTLAGLPPLAGFFGKAWIFWHAANQLLFFLLIIALFCTGVSLVYYLRILRLFWTSANGQIVREISNLNNNTVRPVGISAVTSILVRAPYNYETRLGLTSACAIILIFVPLFYIKPFVL